MSKDRDRDPPSRQGRPAIAYAAAAAILLNACAGNPPGGSDTAAARETREQRIGADDGRDVCRPQLVQFDSAGEFFAGPIIAGAALGAAAGAGTAAAFPRTGPISALIGLAVGAGVGAAAGAAVGNYLEQRRREAGEDQAALDRLVAADLERENAGIDQAQRSFDALLDCRVRAAQQVREAARSGALPAPEAQARLAEIQERTRRDVELAKRVSTRIAERGNDLDTAIDALAPDVRPQVASANATVQAVVVPAVAAQPSVPVRVRPDPAAPAVAQVTPQQPVRVRPARTPGFAVVETESGQRLGYAPVEAFSTRGAGRVATPVRLAMPPSPFALPPPDATTANAAGAGAAVPAGRVRSLAATNIARRDNFIESVRHAESLANLGFETAI